MGMSHIHYLPLAPSFFAIPVGFFFLVLILRSVRYAYESIGVSSNTAILRGEKTGSSHGRGGGKNLATIGERRFC